MIGARAFAAAFEQAVRLDRHDANFIGGLKLTVWDAEVVDAELTRFRRRKPSFSVRRVSGQITRCDEATTPESSVKRLRKAWNGRAGIPPD
jgi:hypothetical protein